MFAAGRAPKAAAPAGAAITGIEQVFSTFLYNGNNTNPRDIVNGIDLVGKGGLVWTKLRDTLEPHLLVDTARGATRGLSTNTTNAQDTANHITAFNSDGYRVSNQTVVNGLDTNRYVSWTFAEQPKFFDIVTYTGTGSARTIAHSLGSTPGWIVVKELGVGSTNWCSYHRGAPTPESQNYYLSANDAVGASGFWNNTTPTSSVFSLGTSDQVNGNGQSYVAYLFAHNAGGFGSTGTDSVISCGTYTGNGAAGGQQITLGWEPQWILVKSSNTGGNWNIYDTTRGWDAGGNDYYIFANTTNAESDLEVGNPNSTGFLVSGNNTNNSGTTYIYVVIRRPMNTPTSATSVFDVGLRSGSGSRAKTTSSIFTDLAITKQYSSAGEYWGVSSRNTGILTLQSNSMDANLQGALYGIDPWATMTGVITAAGNGAVNSGSLVDYSFKRAPGFFDVVCDTGTGSARTVSHNLGVIPEMVIRKSRSTSTYWLVGLTQLNYANDEYLQLQGSNAVNAGGGSYWNSTGPTSSVFSVGNNSYSNGTGATFVSYLFATLAGISKVGKYTGTGSALAINCGFTTGARFVLIKRTDSTGDWFLWDTAQGIISGNDPYHFVNSTAARVTNTDYIDPTSSGFEISSSAPAAVNASGGTFIFLAIA